MSRGCLEVALVGGLGNRLLALAGAAALAQHCGASLRLAWRLAPAMCPCDFGELFEPLELPGLEWVACPAQLDGYEQVATVEPLLMERLLRGDCVRVRWLAFELEAASQNAELAVLRRRFLLSLKPRPEVRRLAEAQDGAEVGLHVRGGDHLPARLLTPLWACREVLAAIRDSRPGMRVMICSDTPGIAERLCEGLRLERVPAPSERLASGAGRSTTEGVRAALAELLLLGNCRLVFTSPASTFARTAAELGNARVAPLVGIQKLDSAAFHRRFWRLHSAVTHVPATDLWSGAGLSGRLAALAANIGTGGFCQWHAPWFLRNRVRNRCRAFLAQAS